MVTCEVCASWSQSDWDAFLTRRTYKDRPYAQGKRSYGSPHSVPSPVVVSRTPPIASPLGHTGASGTSSGRAKSSSTSLACPAKRVDGASVASGPSFRPSLGRWRPVGGKAPEGTSAEEFSPQASRSSRAWDSSPDRSLAEVPQDQVGEGGSTSQKVTKKPHSRSSTGKPSTSKVSQKVLPGVRRLPSPLQVSAETSESPRPGHAQAPRSKGAARDISGDSGQPRAPSGDSRAGHGSLTDSQSISGKSRAATDSRAASVDSRAGRSAPSESGAGLNNSRASSNSRAIPGNLEESRAIVASTLSKVITGALTETRNARTSRESGGKLPKVHKTDGTPLPNPTDDVDASPAGAVLQCASVEDRLYTSRADVDEVNLPAELGVHTSAVGADLARASVESRLYSRRADVNAVKMPGVDSAVRIEEANVLKEANDLRVHTSTDDRGMSGVDSAARTTSTGVPPEEAGLGRAQLDRSTVIPVEMPCDLPENRAHADSSRDCSYGADYGQGDTVRQASVSVPACGGSAPEHERPSRAAPEIASGASQGRASGGFGQAAQMGNLASFGGLAKQAGLHIKDPLVQALAIAHPKVVSRTLQNLSSGTGTAPPADHSTPRSGLKVELQVAQRGPHSSLGRRSSWTSHVAATLPPEIFGSPDPTNVVPLGTRLAGVSLTPPNVQRSVPPIRPASLFTRPASVPPRPDRVQAEPAKRPASPPPLATKRQRVIPAASGRPEVAPTMGPTQAEACGRPPSPDRQTAALVASLRQELADLRQRVEEQDARSSARQAEEDAGEEDERPAVARRLRSFRRFVTESLPDYVAQPDPADSGSCSLALASLDRSFEEDRRSRAVDQMVESALPLSPLLVGAQQALDRHLQGRAPDVPLYSVSEPLSSFRLHRGDKAEQDRGFKLAAPRMYGCNPRSYKIRASRDHELGYLVAPPIIDRDFARFSTLSPAELRPSVEETLLCEQMKMLSYGDYAMAVGLQSADVSGADAAEVQARAKEALQVGLRAIEHAAGVALKTRANLELARRDRALASLNFDAETKAQLRTLPLGQDELFAGKLDEASRQAEERSRRQRELKGSFKIPRVPAAASQSSAPVYEFTASAPRGGQSARSRGGRGAKTRGRGRGAAQVDQQTGQTQPQVKAKAGRGRRGRSRRGRGRGGQP